MDTADRERPWIRPAWIAVWLGCAIAGLHWLNGYAARPGAVGVAPETWPAMLGEVLDRRRFTLIVALHPGCSCSRATVAELERLSVGVGDRMALRFLIARPPQIALAEAETEFHLRTRFPTARLFDDPSGRIAARLGALTSGFSLLYDADGMLRFAGGVTRARGHQGDNAGVRSIRDLVLREKEGQAVTPVFGCPLEEREVAWKP